MAGIKVRHFSIPTLQKAAALFSIAVFLLGLGLFAYAGTYSRYWADDYCYSATIKQMGLFAGIADWYRTSGNRLTTLAAVAFSELFGPWAISFVPLAVLALWTAAWTFFLTRLARLLRFDILRRWLFLLAVIEVYFVVLLAPDRLQSVYWRMGTFHYTLPLPLLLINLGILVGFLSQPAKSGVWVSLLSGFLGFLAAGLSETFAVLQAGLFGLGITACLSFLRGERRAHAARLLSAPLVGSLLMMGIMMSAPANIWRQAVMPAPDNLLLILPYSLRYAADFIFYTIRGQVIPFVVYLAGLAALALLVMPQSPARLSRQALLSGIVMSLLTMYALIACSFAPSAFAALQYPAGRALMPGAFILLAGLGAAAGLAALLLRQAFSAAQPGWLGAAALIVLFAFSFYPFRAVSVPRADIAQLAIRAQRWDARNAEIRHTLGAGNREIFVAQTDVVNSLEDIGPNAKYWINLCAAVYYGANSITANP